MPLERRGDDWEKNCKVYLGDQLEQPIKRRLDNSIIALVTAVDLTYLSSWESKTVSELAGEGEIKLSANIAQYFKGMAGTVIKNVC